MNPVLNESYVGESFGKWTVLSGAPSFTRRKRLLCKCECGNVVDIDRSNLVSGKSRMCTGCQKETRTGPSSPTWKGTKDIPSGFFYILKDRAKERGIEFEVTINDVQELWEKCNGKCSLSGMPIVMSTKKMGCTASVDRIDSNFGYTKDNIQMVHKYVNIMKNRFSQDFFIEVCKNVASRCA